MSIRYVVDTHALIWYLEGNTRLGDEARRVLSEPESTLHVPAMVHAEAVWLIERKKVGLDSIPALLDTLSRDPRIKLIPLDLRIIEAGTHLSAINEMHDRLIVATAICLRDSENDAILISRDESISASGLVKVLW